MEEAWRRRLAPDLAASSAAAASSRGAQRRRGPFTSWGGRRIGASLAAAVVAGLMLGSTAFAASRAGGPLYDARLSLEALALPGDPNARLDAELARAQTRIAEIAEAASRGDDGAVNAAVGAYAQALADLDESTGDAAGRARDAVIAHQAVLRNLLLRVSIQAQGGIERAITNSSATIDLLDLASPKPADTPVGPANGNPNAGGGNPNAGGGNPTPGAAIPTPAAAIPTRGGGNGGAGGGNNNGGNGGGNGDGNPAGRRRERGRWRTGAVAATRTPAPATVARTRGRPGPSHSKKPNKAEPTPSD